MRAGSSSMVAQQSLTPDASAIIKQALTLARHRGHAQVTPFHVAITLLSLPNSLLRSSCFHSHSQTHPLRTRALDLCFNVALNRLPSSSSTTMMLGSFRVHNKPPSLSNSLMATFKRAQAHQRRGSEQQMMVNAVRIDVEQLIMSILDDPSISRVMKEAGFVSAQVKAYIEKLCPELNTREVRRNDKSLDLNLNYDSNSFSRIKRNERHGLPHETTSEVVYSSSSDVSPSSSNRATSLPLWLLQHDEGRLEPSSNKVSVPNSNSSTETSEVNYHPKFNELNSENLKILCDSLLNISCQKETVSEIASIILKCRSGINRRNNVAKEDAWLFFLGIDAATKRKIATELAAVVFGSNSNIVSISVSNVSCQSGYFERLVEAIQENPHRVFLLEDIDKVDYCTQVAILNAAASGTIDDDIGFSDAIMILSCENFDLKLRTKGRDDGASFDLNLCAENDQFDSSFDSVGLLEAVDRTILFNCFNDL